MTINNGCLMIQTLKSCRWPWHGYMWPQGLEPSTRELETTALLYHGIAKFTFLFYFYDKSYFYKINREALVKGVLIQFRYSKTNYSRIH